MSRKGEIREAAAVEFAGEMKYKAWDERGNEISMEAAPRVGGSGNGTAPLELFLAALGGCIAVNTMTVLKERGKEYRSFRVEVEGFRRGEIPRLFKRINVSMRIEGDLEEETVEEALKTVIGSRCPLSVLVGSAVKLAWDFRLEGPRASPGDSGRQK